MAISADLFWPSDPSTTSPLWPNVTEFHVSFAPTAPNGDWYFMRDPVQPPPENDEGDDIFSDHGTTSDSDSLSEADSSGFDSDDSFFAPASPLPLETYNVTREARLTGRIPTRVFRTWPSPILIPLLTAMARAVARMPKLRSFAAGCDIQPCARTNYSLEVFDLDFLVPGQTCSRDKEVGDQQKRRLYWTIPRGWRTNDELQSAWREVIEEDGVVRYEEW